MTAKVKSRVEEIWDAYVAAEPIMSDDIAYLLDRVEKLEACLRLADSLSYEAGKLESYVLAGLDLANTAYCDARARLEET